jgi:selenocysteine-specific elongation factor
LSNVVIGTAGHIDHGKTSLVKILSGVDTDRLKEEKARGLTIELGFAQLKLPSGKSVALVDVPGHERFIKNMLAGAAGIDLALLVVAADEGIMPQTREHFEIIRLLEIKKMIVVITKTDLVENDLIGLVNEEIESLLQGTIYQNSVIFTFSAVSGAGKEELLQGIDKVVAEFFWAEKGEGVPRLPIDRVFMIQGFGTVVTGTLFSGEITVGKQLFIPLKDKIVRVRNLQVHNQAVEKVQAGQRVAVNLAGIEYGEVERGDVLTEEGWFIPTQRIDVLFSLLENAPCSLKKFTRIRFHQGTIERMGRVVLFDREELIQGEEAYLQLMLEKPVVVQKNDKFVLRSYSPSHTIGGGTIIEPQARKHRRKDLPQVMEEFTLKMRGTPEEAILFQLEKSKQPMYLGELVRAVNCPESTINPIVENFVQKGQVQAFAINDKEKIFISRGLLGEWENLMLQKAKQILQEKPLEPGVNKELLRSMVFPQLNLKEYNTLLQYWIQQKRISLIDGLYLLPFGFNTEPQGQWLEMLQAIEKLYRKYRWRIPEWKTVVQELSIEEKAGTRVLHYMLRKGMLIQLAGENYILKEYLNEGQEKLREWLKEHESLTVAQARDILETTRKSVVPFLEYLDKVKFTQRLGDIRKLVL